MKQKRHIFGAVMLVVCAAWSTVSFAASSYTVTIPATLLVQNSGWNSLGKLSATGSLEENYELVVTASSTNGFNLVNTTDTNAKVPYVFMEKSSGEGKSYSDVQNSGQTEWKFDTLGTDAQFKDLGIVVDDYSRVKHGSYSSNVTFSAEAQKVLTILNGKYALTKGTWLAIGFSYSNVYGETVIFEYDGTSFSSSKLTSKQSGSTMTLGDDNLISAHVHNSSDMSNITIDFDVQVTKDLKLVVSNVKIDNNTGTASSVSLQYKKPSDQYLTSILRAN